MKTTKLLLIILLVVAPFAQLLAQRDYKENWAKVDSLTRLNLPKSALAEIDVIYQDASKDGNSPQVIKSFIHKLKFKNQIEDNAFERLCSDLDSTVKVSSFPENAVMHSMLGEMYLWYYQNNRYKFYNRTNTIGFKNDDMQTWTLDQLVEKMIFHYNTSLKDATKLQKLPTESFKVLISAGTMPVDRRPTLYDFLANRAIDFFSNQEMSVTKPADSYAVTEAFYFASAKEFSTSKITTTDKLSVHFHAMKTLQDLISFRISRPSEKNALIDAELKRMATAYRFSVHPDKDDLYLKALLRGEKKFKGIEASGEITYAIASHRMNMGAKYSYSNPETHKYKNEKVEALKLCNKVIKKYPKSYAAKQCESLAVNIQHHNLTFTVEKTVGVNQKFSSFINYQNTPKAYIQVVEIDMSKYEKLTGLYYGKELFDKLLSSSTKKYDFSQDLKGSEDFNTHSTETLLKGLPLGFYVVIMSNNAKYTYEKGISSYSPVRVSNISYMMQPLSDGSKRVFVADRNTGKPLANVVCQVWKQKYSYTKRRYVRRNLKKYRTDKNGMVILKTVDGNDYASFYIDFSLKDDFLTTNNSFYLYKSGGVAETQYRTELFTDRAIYRPGQTIHFKGLSLEITGEKVEISPAIEKVVELYDPNYQKVASLNLKSNEFGTFSGTFDIPMGLMNGSFFIQTSGGSKYISVEEYKRPKFETKLEPFKGNYKLGEKVTAIGKATSFAGSVISDADVKYTITRSPKWRGWYSRYYSSPATVIKNGTTKTDDAGRYKIEFNAIPDAKTKESEFAYFSYSIKVDVTDISGETQSTSGSMSVGFRALTVSLPLSGGVNSNDPMFKDEKDKMFEISTKNLNGEFVEAQGTVTIYMQDGPKTLERNRLWSEPEMLHLTAKEWSKQFPNNVYSSSTSDQTKMVKGKQVTTFKFNTKDNKTRKFLIMKKYKPGYYVAEIKSKDSYGKAVSNKHFFSIFSDKQTKMPYKSPVFFKQLNTICEPGEIAEFMIGSSYKKVKVIYQIEHKDKIIKTVQLDLNDEVKKIKIPVTEAHRGNFAVHFSFIKDNRIYNNYAIVGVPHSDKKLDIEFASFRDKLLPGEKEEWTITIKGHKGEKIVAEMMATLYDASLDQFKVNNWNLDIFKSYYATSTWSSNAFTQVSSTILKFDMDYAEYVTSRHHSSFNWFNFSYYTYRYRDYFLEDDSMVSESAVVKTSALGKRSRSKKESKMDKAVSAPMAEDAEESEESDPGENASGLLQQNLGGKDKPAGGMGSVKVRTNFNETAFFYPHLKTNDKGEVVVSFTVPESLTKWKMMGFAHTKDLKFGFIKNELVTQKDLMLMPNVPRFFRENDKLTFPVKISNISKEDMNGKVQLEFFDAISMKPIANIFAKGENQNKDFSVKAGGNSLVEWNLEIPEGVSAVTYKVIAKSGKFSDGEQKPLPILSNRMLVTESLPLPIRGNSEKTLKFNKLLKSGKSKSLRHHKLTLEFTSNPAWYAVQALPYMIEYPYECSEQTFSRFYANSIASHAANSSPKIKRVFDAWKKTPDSGALLSNLEKNQELKAVLLEETPWVLDGKDESQRKKRLGLLFDLNRMSNEQARALKKLQKAQKFNGGWPWFEGMQESRYITQYIVNGLGHLDVMGVKSVREDAKTWKMIEKAVGFLDGELEKEYKYLKKYNTDKEMEENHLSTSAIQYMYGRTYFNEIPKSKKTQKAYDYFEGQAKKYWTSQGIYMQGMIALALKRVSKEDVNSKKVADIVKSLKENAATDDELGMYWKNNVSGYYWHQAPIEVQALMIEVFDVAGNDLEAVEELKIWLLKQKQTQDWKTTRATAEAVYALLMRGTSQLASDELVEIKLGGKLIDPKQIDGVDTEAGTGYFKTSWSGSDIKPEMGKVELKKKDAGVAWGALYWQYFEDLDKITTHETPLKLKKQLFIERQTSTGKAIEPITNAELKIGDKVIVRIELRVDRRMEYIHMKDMRASGFEPINVISRYKYQDGLGYYESTKDAATNFFMGSLPKGTYVFEYPLRVTHKGDFANGITTIQCMYAPEFTSHSEGVRVTVK